MESRWYLFHGQNMENTKISDRAHALHITKNEWSKITKHLDRKKLIQEALDKEEAVKRYLDEGSKSMTKSWENSLENVRKRKEEDRRRLIEQKEDDRMQRFFKMREEQEIARKKYVEKVKHDSFMKSGNAKKLTSAFITSEIMHEREKQKEFVEQKKLKDLEEELEFAEIVKQRAMEEIQENEEKEMKAREKNKIFAIEFRQILEEKIAREKAERLGSIRREAADQIAQREEMQKIKEHEESEKLRKQHENQMARKQAIKEEKLIEIRKQHEERELEEVIQIYKDAKDRIDCLKKVKVKELQDAAVKRRDAIAKLVMAEAKKKDAEEELFLKNAIREREAAELAKIQAKLVIQEKMRQERIDDINAHMIHAEQIKKKEEELEKWELVNRFKVDEYNKIYEKKKKQEEWEKILHYRKELLEQIEDNKQEVAREKAIDEAFARKSLEMEDKKFYNYAEEVMQMAKSTGRSTYPIEKVIKEYTKTNNIGNHVEDSPYCQDLKSNNFGDAIIVRKIITDQNKASKRHCRCNIPNK